MLPTLLLAALMVMVPLILILSVILAILGYSAGGGGQFRRPACRRAGWLRRPDRFLLPSLRAVRLLPLIVLVASEDVGPIAALKRASR